MPPGISIALSGAPGSGKTSIAQLAVLDGWKVITVEELAEIHGLLGEYDSDEGAREIDIETLRSSLGSIQGPLIIDGHLSHRLKVDAVAILRCKPDILRDRLQKRDYPKWKVESNVEWELIGSSWSEIENENVAEFETTFAKVNDTWSSIGEWISENCPSREPLIDWMND